MHDGAYDGAYDGVLAGAYDGTQGTGTVPGGHGLQPERGTNGLTIRCRPAAPEHGSRGLHWLCRGTAGIEAAGRSVGPTGAAGSAGCGVTGAKAGAVVAGGATTAGGATVGCGVETGAGVATGMLTCGDASGADPEPGSNRG